MASEVREHVIRSVIPWRDEGPKTECGLPAGSYPSVTRDEMVEKIRSQGKARASITSCMTCWQTSGRWPSWEENPAAVLNREVSRAAWRPEDNREINAELRALAALVAEHQQEFDGYIAGLAEAVDLQDKRTAKRMRG